MLGGAARPARGTVVKICFGPFTLDLDARQLTQSGCEIHLEPKAFDLLATLVLDRPRALSKGELLKRLWRDTVVEEANLSNLVAGIRAALGDHAHAPVYVRTMHGFGYAFCGEATTLPGRHQTGADRPICWLECDTQRFPLSIGEHVIGRDPDVDIRLEGSTVSRRHARLVVKSEGTVLEDFGSKNGTFRGSQRVSAPMPLADGDAIYIGSLLVTFHVRAGAMSTDTQARPAR
jgi:DNA-binding winged helix-turn-helix (wHTH) protein